MIRTSPIPVKGYGGGKTPSKKPQYPTQATPEQVARLAYNMEKSRQMTGADGRYDKPKAIIIAAVQTPLQMQQEQNLKNYFKNVRQRKLKKSTQVSQA